jgi:hypothetical protein
MAEYTEETYVNEEWDETCYDIQGKLTQCGSADNRAIGAYFLKPLDPNAPDCGATQPIAVVVGNTVDNDGNKVDNVVYGCNGTTDSFTAGDIYALDDTWKPYLIYVLAAMVIGLTLKLLLISFR